MFGSRLKSWMENYIGRPKKKVQAENQKEKSKKNGAGGLILESSESLALSDTGISSGSQQVLSSSTTDYRESYSTATMDSDRSGLIHCQTAISLPSPESAYSTGYSTDGTSPGGTGPPEYYINIRTGKHYFPSPAPTPTSPHPDTAFAQLYSAELRPTMSFFQGDTRLPPRPIRPPRPGRESLAAGNSHSKSHLHTLSTLPDETAPHFVPSASACNTLSPSGRLDTTGLPKTFRKKSSSKAQCTSLKLFLKSPRRDTTKSKADVSKSPPFDNKRKSPSPLKAKKWFKQPFHKFGHRRIDSCDDNAATGDTGKEIDIDKGICYLPTQDAAASPRQRNRIKTNPWLPTAPTSSLVLHDFHPTFPASVLTRNRSCSNTPLQNRKSTDFEFPRNRGQQLADGLNILEKSAKCGPNGNLILDTSDRSEEDLTLNEMMGTYNESYVYEKETDILSDSDPTDCEDYETDSEADKGGDERDSHDDELDFIDNASITDSDDSCPPNTGRCTYHDICANRSSFLCKGERRHSRKDSEHRRSLRRNLDLKGRRERRRQGKKCSKCEDEEKKKQQQEGRASRSRPEIDENIGGLSLRKALLQKVLARSVSRVAEASPVTGRKGHSHPFSESTSENVKLDVSLVDREADERYKELMKEAENMFESLQNSPVVKNRKKIHPGDSDRRSEKSAGITKEPDRTRFVRDFETKPPETPQRKSPKHLALKIPVETPKKPGRLRLEPSKNNSFKARSSAHSPLDPLGPTFRNFSVFQPSTGNGREIPTSSSDDSDPSEAFRTKTRAPESPIVPIAFQSVDLGKPLTSYCPQSEPVKRKIYSCSKTYDRLVKHLEKNTDIFEETQNGVPHDSISSNSPHPSSPRLSYRRHPQLFA